MSRKGENIYKRKDGRWEGRYKIGYYMDGRIRYRSVYGKSYKEAKLKLYDGKQLVESQYPTGKTLPGSFTMTRAVNLWLEERRLSWKDSTYATYRTIIEKQILPYVGDMPIRRFTPEHYRTFLSERRSGAVKLSNAYIHQIHNLILQIFKYLEKKYGYSAPSLEEPKSDKRSKPLCPPASAVVQQLQQYLLKGAELHDRTCLGILLSGCTGIRIGELCALQWKDFDFLRGTMHISKTMQRIRRFGAGKGTRLIISSPKSSCSDREIPLSDEMLIILQQASGRPEDFVLTGRKKSYAEPRTLQYRFQSVLKKLGLKSFNYHMLRHLFATRCLVSGFDLKSISELLGHSNVATTMRLYIHTDMARKRQLMNQYPMTA